MAAHEKLFTLTAPSKALTLHKHLQQFRLHVELWNNLHDAAIKFKWKWKAKWFLCSHLKCIKPNAFNVSGQFSASQMISRVYGRSYYEWMNESEEQTSEWTIKRIEITTKQFAQKSKHLIGTCANGGNYPLIKLIKKLSTLVTVFWLIKTTE